MTSDDIQNAQYQSTENLDARILLHRRFTPPGKDMWDFVWDNYAFKKTDQVLEVGCGTGEFWTHPDRLIAPDMPVFLTDRSFGMVEHTRRRLESLFNAAHFGVAEAEALPYSSNRFRVVLAHFMLYHVADKQQALREFNRVLIEKGWVGIILLGPASMASISNRILRMNPDINLVPSDAAVFNADTADPVIRSVFPVVSRYDYKYTMRVDDPDIILNYAQSMPSIQKLNLDDAFWGKYRDSVLSDIMGHGSFDVAKSCSLFICQKKGQVNNGYK